MLQMLQEVGSILSTLESIAGALPRKGAKSGSSGGLLSALLAAALGPALGPEAAPGPDTAQVQAHGLPQPS